MALGDLLFLEEASRQAVVGREPHLKLKRYFALEIHDQTADGTQTEVQDHR